jgi:catechol 2,3-dioxygenase-like lactoylglutathione lyase family enzyme
MPVTFNHCILAARDRHESASFLANILGLPEPTSWGPFTQVQLDAGVTIQFAEPPVDEIQMQHYAFLVDDERFDEILGRVEALGIRYVETDRIDTIADGVAGRWPDPRGPGRPPHRARRRDPRWRRLDQDRMPMLYEHAGLVVERSAVLGIAAICEQPGRFAGRRVTAILCRSNVGPVNFARWVLEPVRR